MPDSPRSKGGKGNVDVVFLYKMVPGRCPGSFGIQVAALAGLPWSIRERAAVVSLAWRSQQVGQQPTVRDTCHLTPCLVGAPQLGVERDDERGVELKE